MATGTLTEQVAEQVAEELEQAAVVTRRIDGRVIGSFWIGVGVGVTIGFYIGYRYSKKKLRAEIFEEAEKEITEVREQYRRKIVAAEAQDKPSVKDVIKEKGYDTTEESDLRIEYAHLDDPTETRPTRPPVPVQEPPRGPFPPREIPTPIDPNARVFRTDSAQKDKDDDWDWETEIAQRSPLFPFILHQDEFTLNESGYSQVSYVYYSIDDVLVDEDDPTTILNNRENLIGAEALDRFGHGSDDYNLVHVRNSELQMEFVINRVKESWDEEVLGLDRNDPD